MRGCPPLRLNDQRQLKEPELRRLVSGDRMYWYILRHRWFDLIYFTWRKAWALYKILNSVQCVDHECVDACLIMRNSTKLLFIVAAWELSPGYDNSRNVPKGCPESERVIGVWIRWPASVDHGESACPRGFVKWQLESITSFLVMNKGDLSLSLTHSLNCPWNIFHGVWLVHRFTGRRGTYSNQSWISRRYSKERPALRVVNLQPLRNFFSKPSTAPLFDAFRSFQVQRASTPVLSNNAFPHCTHERVRGRDCGWLRASLHRRRKPWHSKASFMIITVTAKCR